MDGDLFRSIQDLIRSECNKYHTDLENIKSDIKQLSDRITALEENTISVLQASQNSQHQEIINVIQKRHENSRNLIFFNMEELDELYQQDDTSSMVREILKRFISKSVDCPKSLSITFPNQEEELSVVPEVSKYSEFVRMPQDLMTEQKEHAKNLEIELTSIIDSGKNATTYNDFNDTPKIVGLSSVRVKMKLVIDTLLLIFY